MDLYVNLPQLEAAREKTHVLQRRLACAARDIRALERGMDQSVWSGKGRDGFVRLFRLFEQALDGMQATLDEKQTLLGEAALEAGHCLQSETEGFCEAFTAAES